MVDLTNEQDERVEKVILNLEEALYVVNNKVCKYYVVIYALTKLLFHLTYYYYYVILKP